MDATTLQNFLARCSHDELRAFRDRLDQIRGLAAEVETCDLAPLVERLTMLSSAFRDELVRRIKGSR